MKKICMRYLGKGKIMDQWIRKTDAADHMKEVTNNGVTYLTFPALDATGIVTHAFPRGWEVSAKAGIRP